MSGRGCFDRCRSWISIQRADFQHLGDWGDASDRFLRELADAERERPRQLAIQVHGAATHAGNYAGVFGLGSSETNQDNVALGAIRILEYAEHLNVYGFRFRSLKHR